MSTNLRTLVSLAYQKARRFFMSITDDKIILLPDLAAGRTPSSYAYQYIKGIAKGQKLAYMNGIRVKELRLYKDSQSVGHEYVTALVHNSNKGTFHYITFERFSTGDVASTPEGPPPQLPPKRLSDISNVHHMSSESSDSIKELFRGGSLSAEDAVTEINEWRKRDTHDRQTSVRFSGDSGPPLHDLYALACAITATWQNYTVIRRNCYFFAALFLAILKDEYKGKQSGESLEADDEHEVDEEGTEHGVEGGLQGTYKGVRITKPGKRDKNTALLAFNNLKSAFYEEVTKEEEKFKAMDAELAIAKSEINVKDAQIAELQRLLAKKSIPMSV